MDGRIKSKLRAFAKRMCVDIVEFPEMEDGFECARVRGHNIECAIIYYDHEDRCVYWY